MRGEAIAGPLLLASFPPVSAWVQPHIATASIGRERRLPVYWGQHPVRRGQIYELSAVDGPSRKQPFRRKSWALRATSKPEMPQVPRTDLSFDDFLKELEKVGVAGVRFLDGDQDGDELAVCCPETRRIMDCTVDMYAQVEGEKFCVALPMFSPVAICYHKGERLIPVDNDSELMDRLYDFLAPSLEQEDLYLIRSPVCLTLDGDLGDLGEGDFEEEELEGWEEYEDDDDPWQDDDDDPADEQEPVDMELEKTMNPRYWDDADAADLKDTFGEEWEKVAAFKYDGLEYTMVKILEPVLVLAKEDPAFKGITQWVLPSEQEAERIGPIMEGIIRCKLGIEDSAEDDDEEEEEEEGEE